MSFTCGIPRNADEFARLFSFEQSLFGDLTIPVAVAREIFVKRPETFCIITDRRQAVAAYSIAYPLRPRWADALIAGEIVEADLTPDMLLDRHESHEGAFVYISSVVVDRNFDALTKATLLANLLWWRAQQLRLVSLNRLTVFMMPVSKQGERLIRLIGARQLNDGQSRKDGYPIYGRQVSPRFLVRATEAIEKFCNPRLVAMNLDFGPDAPIASRTSGQSLVGRGMSAAKAFWATGIAAPRAKTAWSQSLLPSGIVALLTTILLSIEIPVFGEHPSLLFLLAIWLLALRFGRVPMLLATAVAGLSGAFFFYPPQFSLYIDDPLHVAELLAFAVGATSGIELVNRQFRPVATTNAFNQRRAQT